MGALKLREHQHCKTRQRRSIIECGCHSVVAAAARTITVMVSLQQLRRSLGAGKRP